MVRKILLSIIALFFFLKTNAQCAMCRAVLESGEDQNMAEGINDGIVFLMAVPYILVGAIGFIIYRKFSKPDKTESTNQNL
ncbi:hypothetical protein ADIWIN_2108 [Winogradskyella psychrotolerans RS-3]|uniref:Co/Zn/Cd efflux system membrane fusion protein n=1 Tax=Winogradskyella psychrotolerans RS-3 TaxID=641526 RepID=S7VRD4_9FLAO|nr:hypothetical protein [Winogradskyella psychrotolerans]EPR72785.1 hypothetical protein ADIWIN_2108 [Winogradskyella psychrotolerans RS-3]